jgi:pimeloyl-ACP methyl ester carboxylesterase
MPFIKSSDNVQIYYSKRKGKKEKKKEETIIFLHGWLQNHSVWNKERDF